ncbi:porin family protein [Acinetobacter wuhouensis]|uniref:Uncharacterized protein n=1 Tax=Acinetobacter wuhouensis TaxID=1879050 RepID=A0A4Q7ADE5_9GAMM|nr:hypothetical protein [Acinetobacter wuhouensis]RZG44405.1 hypothetical protein EXU28_14655 [Acinetobacter wuhouensis]RZG74009.1 hypothetical protein EXU29_05965 [Acinetobacter wuhouensis]
MKINRYLCFSLGILLSQVTFSSELSESLQGSPKLNINLYAFAADVDGKISKGKVNYDVDQPFKETLKDLDRSFMGHVDLSKGKWGIYTDLQKVETSQEKSAMHIPIALGTKLDQRSYGIYYQAYISPEKTAKNQAKLIVEPTVGTHRTKAEATLAVLNQGIDVHATWDEFFWGSRFKYNFDSSWNLASEVTFGSENTISAQAYIGYRIPVLSRDLNLRAGYRYFEQDYKSDHFHWDIRQHGPVIGINLPIF